MKKFKDILCVCLVIGVIAGSIYAPNVLYAISDSRTLEQMSEIAMDDSSGLSTKVASINDKLSLFGNSYEAIATSISEEEKNMVLQKAKKEMEYFFSLIGYETLVSEADNVKLTKNIYVPKEGTVYSFAAYKVEVQKSYCIIEIVIDAEDLVILHAELYNIDKFYDSGETGKEAVYNELLNLIGYYGDRDIKNLNIEEVGIKILSIYYEGFIAEVKGSEITNSSTGKDDSNDNSTVSYISSAYVYKYQLIDEKGEAVGYDIEVTDSGIFFNN